MSVITGTFAAGCACEASGQAVAKPAMTLMKSRRRIASTKGPGLCQQWPAIVPLQQGIADGGMGVQTRIRVAKIPVHRCRIWVTSAKARNEHNKSGLPPKAELQSERLM